ncbi:hypothetical protein NicSoilB8_15680 [Arthrobacter sp. NicSoilB8]|nr:hypothetical protein NicSoilB8_15680 [Arthrobacter sp. NicSoilB8]
MPEKDIRPRAAVGDGVAGLSCRLRPVWGTGFPGRTLWRGSTPIRGGANLVFPRASAATPPVVNQCANALQDD